MTFGVARQDAGEGEDPRYLSDQLITYLGNKRALLGPIREAIEEVTRRVGRPRLRMLDAFSGSGVVSRLMKRYAERLVVNDFEDYAAVISRCYLADGGDVPFHAIEEAIGRIETGRATLADGPCGFIERLYAPNDEREIQASDRVFYTRDNARRLDYFRQAIEAEAPELRDYLLGPLLSGASIHANTAGVFKGFYKDRRTGVGQFGGSGRDALSRITAPIVLRPPVLSRYSCEVRVLQADANELPLMCGEFDLAYIDPPYNQHPYGSNYFMLNLLVGYEEPGSVSRVSGIPPGWRRSKFNQRRSALASLRELVTRIDARFLLISYNDEGFISIDEMRAMLGGLGSVEERQLPYATFRGSRNLANRSVAVTEHLFLVEKW